MKTRMRLVVLALLALIGAIAAPSSTTAAGNRQQFLLNSPEGSTTTTITATGVFNGVGEDIVVDEGTFEEGRNGRFEFTQQDEFVFDEGTLYVSIAGRGRESFDEANCAGTVSGRATYEITGGTGLFEGADGRGRATFDSAFAGEQDENGECVFDEAAGVFFAKLTGNLRLEGSVVI